MPFPTTPILDDFNRADGALGSNWSLRSGAGGIVSNQAGQSGGGDYGERWIASTYGPNAEMFVSIVTVGNGISLAIDNDGAGNYYGVNYDRSISTTTADLIVSASGSESVLGASISVSFTDGDGIGLARRGDQLQLWKRSSGVWSFVDSRTDTQVTTGGYIGFYLYGGAQAWIDNFGGGSSTSRLSALGVG